MSEKKFPFKYVIMLLAAVELLSLFLPAVTIIIQKMTGFEMIFGLSYAGQTIIHGNLLGILTILIPIALIGLWFIQAVPKKSMIAAAASGADILVWILMVVMMNSSKEITGGGLVKVSVGIGFGLILEVLLNIGIIAIAVLMMLGKIPGEENTVVFAAGSASHPYRQQMSDEDVPVAMTQRVCPVCGKNLGPDAMFCPGCGTKYVENRKPFCIHCGRAVQEGEAFCPNCGTPVAASAPMYKAAQPRKKSKAGAWIALTTFILSIAVIVGALVYMNFGPQAKEQKYQKAQELFMEGKIEDAVKIWRSLGDYKDSAALAEVYGALSGMMNDVAGAIGGLGNMIPQYTVPSLTNP